MGGRLHFLTHEKEKKEGGKEEEMTPSRSLLATCDEKKKGEGGEGIKRNVV